MSNDDEPFSQGLIDLDPLVLTPENREKWNDTSSMMIWKCPGFTHLWYKLLQNGCGEDGAIMTRAVPYAATDGKNILINPDSFFKFKLPERLYIMAHEVMHNVYGDVDLLYKCNAMGSVPTTDGGKLPFRESTMQRAMDLRINALLNKTNIGKAPKEGHYDPKMTGEEGVLDTYKKCYLEEGPDPEGDGTGGGKDNPGGFDTLKRPGLSTGQSAQDAQRNPGQWQVEMAAAEVVEQDKAHGKLAGALKRLFQAILEPEVDWRNHIQTLINRVSGTGGWNWKQPDEWWAPHEFFSPRRSGKGAGWIVIWGDTSGSRGDDEIASNMAELAGILEDLQPARITVLWCDAEIAFVDEVSDPADLAKIQARGVKGGLGTSQEPVFQWIADQMDQPDLYIGFTDGFVDFPPKAPAYPVIWASSTDKDYPWGQVVRVNRKPKQL